MDSTWTIQKTQYYCHIVQTTQKTSHVIAILPIHLVCCYLAASITFILLLCAHIAESLSSCCLMCSRHNIFHTKWPVCLSTKPYKRLGGWRHIATHFVLQHHGHPQDFSRGSARKFAYKFMSMLIKFTFTDCYSVTC
jgi:hypothetical protein